MQRLIHTTADTEKMIDQLLSGERHRVGPQAARLDVQR
jgi:hypothetical protein